MTIQLDCGSIGVKADQLQAIEHAAKFGYQSVSAYSDYLASLSPDALKKLKDDMGTKNVTFGNAGLPNEFRKGDDEFTAGLKLLADRAAALQRAGVTRVTTWISPTHDSLTFLQNLKQHAARLRQCAAILGDHGCRLGLEYVGPKTSWTAKRYPFVHDMRTMKELIAEINKPNVGFVMDSWHWYTSNEVAADILTLSNKDVVSIDLNDAPAGLAVDQQMDLARELPCATGVIPVAGFLNALQKIGCDAPARCEPFNAELRKQTPDKALELTAAAMKKAFALIA
jgi:sugar phosphate isomerase/epimerase